MGAGTPRLLRSAEGWGAQRSAESIIAEFVADEISERRDLQLTRDLFPPALEWIDLGKTFRSDFAVKYGIFPMFVPRRFGLRLEANMECDSRSFNKQ